MTHTQSYPDIVERLRSSEPLPACPFDRLSPHYLTMPDDKPCPFCGQENTTEGPDKCRGADTRIMGEAADEIERLRALAQASPEPVAWTNAAQLGFLRDPQFALISMAMWAKPSGLARIPLYSSALPSTNHQSLDQLLDGMTDENRHEELPTSPISSTEGK